jgi:hypothetical protein
MVCLATTALNVVLFCIPPSVARPEIQAPLRPNPYHNLEHVDKPPKSSRIVNYPTLLTQVSSAKPEMAFPDDPHRYSSSQGYISPEERPFHVTSEVHILALRF